MVKSVHRLLYIIISLFFIHSVIGQDKKVNKAGEQYDKYEYINAQDTYRRIAKKGYRSADLFKNLGNSYYFNSEYSDASKWYKELITSYPDELEPEYYYRYAQTLKSAGNYKEADEYMKKFSSSNTEDHRGELFQGEPDYMKRIDFQSGRFDIKSVSINTPYTDFGAAFYGRFVVFSSSRDTLVGQVRAIHEWNEEPFLELYATEYNPVNGELSEIEKLGGNINSKFHESTPVFTRDGKTVYFTRNNYDGKRVGRDEKGTNKLKIYRSYKNIKGGWTTPQNLSFNSDLYSTAHPTLSNDEKTLYFASDMPGGQGQSDIYSIAIKSGGGFGEPQNLGDKINTEGKETFPFVSENNDLYFASDGHIGLGGLDIFVTRLKPQTEEEGLIVNIGKPVNGPKDDFAFIVDDPSKRGYFSSNRDGGRGKDDIYTFLQLEDLRDFCEITLQGIVTDKDSNELVPGTKVSVYDSSNNLLESYVVGEDAAYSHIVKCSSEYFVRAQKEGYNTTEKLVRTPGKTEVLDVPLSIDTTVKSAGEGDDLAKILSLNPIYFDLDKSAIRPDAEVELAKVIDVMTQYPTMKIDVRSHTDSRSNDTYNLSLSRRRAAATVAYMVGKGIAKDRLTSKGYGEIELVNKCANGVPCSEEEHQLNRRSEFIIVK